MLLLPAVCLQKTPTRFVPYIEVIQGKEYWFTTFYDHHENRFQKTKTGDPNMYWYGDGVYRCNPTNADVKM